MRESVFYTEVALAEVVTYLRHSVRFLGNHTDSCQPGMLPEFVIEGYYQSASERKTKESDGHPNKGRVRFDLVWLNPGAAADELLWDTVVCDQVTRAELDELATAILSEPELDDALDNIYGWVELPELPAPGPLWRYHPERLGRATAFGKGIAKVGMRHQGAPTLTLMQELTAHFVDCDREMLALRPARRRTLVKRDFGRGFAHFQESLFLYAVFCGHGRQLFELPQPLLSMFAKSDVDDIQWSNVKMPYASIYLHFGPQADLDCGEGWLVEGAYLSEVIHEGARHVNICVVSEPPSVEAFHSLDTIAPPCYTAALGPQHMEMPLAEALDLILAEKLNLLRDQSEREPLASEIEKMAREQGVPPGVKIVSGQRQRSTEELGLLSAREDVFRRALRLVVNSLCYLTAYPDDIDTVWPDRTPQHLLRELKNAGKNRNARNRVLDKLAQQGYSAVQICGRTLLKQMASPVAAEAGGARTVATHWARGHWKRQPYGPQNSLRKLQWRMPMLRGTRGLDEGDEVLGHIYAVE